MLGVHGFLFNPIFCLVSRDLNNQTFSCLGKGARKTGIRANNDSEKSLSPACFPAQTHLEALKIGGKYGLQSQPDLD